MGKFYVTTPIYYVNASPHIGHAYTSIIGDCLCRYKRLIGDEVFYLTGTDEHGEKVKEASLDSGEDVQKFVDRVSRNFKDLWKELDIYYNYFIRTTDKNHIKVVQDVIVKLIAQGDIYKDTYRAFYCVPCESFWTQTQIVEGGLCPDCRRGVERVEEDNYFFRLSKYNDWFLKYLSENKDFIKPESRYNEVLGFLENNTLDDLCISRPKSRVSWGIELPNDRDYVVYVWFDALINYITAAGCFTNAARFEKWWPADIHFIGKDILRHHAVFWPIMLKALGFKLPKTIFAHGWWQFQGHKMSKSRGNIVNPFELIKELTAALGGNKPAAIDAVRYFLLREIPIGIDGNFSWPAIVGRVTAELSNDLGNLVFRTLSMAEKYFHGEIQAVRADPPGAIKIHLDSLGTSYQVSMDNCEFSLVCAEIFKLIRALNKYIEQVKPWELWKEDGYEQLRHFLYILLEGLRVAMIYLYPIMPSTSLAVFRQLGLDQAGLSLVMCRWNSSGVYNIAKEQPLFPRIELE
jgi:methionyl-tRNA synthetase